MKYSTITGSLRWSGGNVMLREGQSIDDAHPLLAERPELFTDEAPGASLQSPRRVESGSQRPGESRMERGGTPKVVKAPPRA